MDQDQIKNLETKDSKKKQSKMHAFSLELKLFKSSGNFESVNYNANVNFDVDLISSHWPDKRHQNIKVKDRKSAPVIYIQKKLRLTKANDLSNYWKKS